MYMTYILGARCTDGVVLVSDTKVSGGNIPSCKEKLTPILNNVIMGGAGPLGLINILSDEIKEQVRTEKNYIRPYA